jgi:hypothetical protein
MLRCEKGADLDDFFTGRDPPPAPREPRDLAEDGEVADAAVIGDGPVPTSSRTGPSRTSTPQVNQDRGRA